MPSGDVTQRAVLGAVLAAHPQPVTLDELRASMPDLDIGPAVVCLIEDGLVVPDGDQFRATRAVVRYEELDPV